jgi:flagellar hook-basal body complex protein FliE
MPDPLSIHGPHAPSAPLSPSGAPRPADPVAGEDFAALFKSQLERVSEMQGEADDSLQRLLTGESQDLTDVFTTARKAEVAFSLLLEIRNKLLDAYEELRNLRV